MDVYSRLGMYFFTLGALLAILAGAFTLTSAMYNVVLVLLIFLGVFSAILNVSDEEEVPFIVGATGFLIVIMCFKFLLGHHPLIIGLAKFFEVVTFFIGSMLAIVALRAVFEKGSQADLDPLDHADAIDSHLDTLMFTTKEKTWNFTVFIAVAISFIVILLDVFFQLTQFTTYFFAIDVLITLIFLIDLVVLYKKEGRMYKFLKNCWLDVLATIPIYNIFRVFKIARLFKIARFIKLNKTLKFMSQKSGVKHYVHGKMYDDQVSSSQTSYSSQSVRSRESPQKAKASSRK